MNDVILDLNGILELVTVTYLKNGKECVSNIRVPVGATCEHIQKMQLEEITVLYYSGYDKY